MKASRSITLIAVLGCAAFSMLVTARISLADHTIFSYQVDRFEADGNVLGLPGGALDLVDEFDDGAPGPGWYQAYGTVSEHDGSLFLTNPGVHFPSPTGDVLDLSIAASGPPFLADGQGSFTGTAYWVPILPDAGHHYHFSIYTFNFGGGFVNETFGLGVQRYPDGTYVIEQHLTELNLPLGIYQNLVSVAVPFDAADVTGRIVLRLAFDDATNAVSSSFSLDDGATWQSPFAPAQIFNGRTNAQFILSADPLSEEGGTTTTTATSTTSTTTLDPDPCVVDGCRGETIPLKGVLRMRFDQVYAKFAWKWAKGQPTSLGDFGQPLTTTDYDFCLADANGPLYRGSVPSGNDAPGCWRQSGSASFKFRCDRGIKQAALRAGIDGRASVALSAKIPNHPLSVLLPPYAPPLTARFRTSDGQCFANVFEAVNVKTNSTTQFSAKSSGPLD